MTKSRKEAFTFQMFFFSFLMLATVSVCLGAGKILFEEDFEKRVDGTLDILGGGEGYTLKNDFTDFEFSANFLIVSGL